MKWGLSQTAWPQFAHGPLKPPSSNASSPHTHSCTQFVLVRIGASSGTRLSAFSLECWGWISGFMSPCLKHVGLYHQHSCAPRYLRPTGYVESDKFCNSVIQARCRDGLAEAAPLHWDVRRFDLKAQPSTRGLLGGFPCQACALARCLVMLLSAAGPVKSGALRGLGRFSVGASFRDLAPSGPGWLVPRLLLA